MRQSCNYVMTWMGCMRSQLLRLKRSKLIGLHIICALFAALGCGAYFAYARWDVRFGTDAYVQILGTLMPLMSALVCALAIDDDQAATGLVNILGVPSRRRAWAATVVVLWLLGVATLIAAVGVFGAVLTAAGRPGCSWRILTLSIIGLSVGSFVLYALACALALAWGRNVTIVVGAVGFMLAISSVGGLAHGLMTGELTSLTSGILGWIPTSWPTHLGSLGIELSLTQGSQIHAALSALSSSYAGVAVASAVILVGEFVWIAQVEKRRN